MDLWFQLFAGRPLLDDSELKVLHRLLVALLPHWSVALQVRQDEWSRGIALERGSPLGDAIDRIVSNRSLGSAMLSGAHADLSIHLDSCQQTVPPELNCLTLEIHDATVEGQASEAWARHTFELLVAELPIRYAHVHLQQEFDCKNMILDGGSAEAIGVHLWRSLPGLYWLNYFGAPYVRMIGREKLLSAPAQHVREVGQGVLIALADSPDAWDTDDYRQREQRVIEHLGKQFFFSRHDPERQTIAPEFHLGDA